MENINAKNKRIIMYNLVILAGNLSKDIELRYSPSGTAIAKFAVATNRTYKDQSTEKNKQEVMFIDVTVFGRKAEIANQYLKKGSKVLIEGRLVLDQWVDNSGQKRSKHSVIAEKVQFMDTKSNNSEANKARNNGNTTANKSNRSNSSQANLPSVDINEDEIPF